MLVYQRVTPIDSPSGGFPVEKMGKSSSTTQQIHGVLSTGHEHGQISLGAHREVTVFIHLNSQIFESLLPCLDEFGEDFGGSLVVGVSFHHHQLLLALLEMTHENIHIISQCMMIVPVDLPFLDISGGFTRKHPETEHQTIKKVCPCLARSDQRNTARAAHGNVHVKQWWASTQTRGLRPPPGASARIGEDLRCIRFLSPVVWMSFGFDDM